MGARSRLTSRVVARPTGLGGVLNKLQQQVSQRPVSSPRRARFFSTVQREVNERAQRIPRKRPRR